MTTQRSGPRVAFLLLLALGACSDHATPRDPESSTELAIEVPSAPETDLVASEAAATAIERTLAEAFTRPLAGRALEDAAACLVEAGFRGISPELGPEGTAGPLSIRWLQPAAGPSSSTQEFLAALDALNPLSSAERVETELFRFELAPSKDRATAVARLRWAGLAAADHDHPGARVDLTIFAEIEVRKEALGWRLATFLPTTAPRRDYPANALGSGLRLVGPATPLFVDRTASVGLHLGTSAENRKIIQSFIDRHLTLALGGLGVVDFNGDERPDLIATRSGETSLVFLNDGDSGFVPLPLPIEDATDHPAFLLTVDLDGDGLDELVSSQVSRFDGPLAYAGLWTRTAETPGGEPGPWRHLPRAFPLPNAVGMRRLAVQTVAPLDVEGDGDLDLFFAVYGNAASRGEHYNSVEAHDGADNYLLINQGNLTFTEESDARGIHGTGYTYVALSFDADHDGDFDLFEGNDFGPNHLWRNEGGQFVDDETMGLGGVSAYTMGAALADLEADGAWDLYVSNMSSEEGMRMVPHAADLSDHMRSRVDTIARGNRFFSQPPASGATEPPPTETLWRERAQTLGVHEGEWAWGCQFVDVDGDGAQEILVTNGFASHQDASLGDWQTYYWRQVLDDAARLERGERTADVNTKVRFQGSFNGHERDRLFVRTGGTDPDRPWVDGGYCLGFDDSHDGRAIAPLDADGDGDLDLAILTLGGLEFRENVSAPVASWVRLRLLDGSGQPALGARVYLTAGEDTLARHVALVEGFQSQVSPDLHISLPDGATAIDRMRIRWVDGHEETLEGIPTGQLVTITRTSSGPAQASMVAAAAVPRWASGALAIPSTWSQELEQTTRALRRTKGGTGPRAVAVRRGATEGSDPSPAATAVIDSDGDVLRWFRGTGDEVAIAAFLELGTAERSAPSILIEHGRFALAESRYRDALAIFGRAVEGRGDLGVTDAPAFEGIARAHVYLGRMDLAETAYRRSVELDPDYALGHFNLAASHAAAGRFEEAIRSLLEVQRLEGNTDRVVGSLVENAGSAGAVELAEEYAAIWMKTHPDDADMLTLIGKVEARAGDLLAARSRFERALQLAPRNQEARDALNLTLQLLSRPRTSQK
ncbi:FG-GAP-like repeat-containing protein [Saltatorellus ferox]|uniref:FG-GAP-like repeat-containing protein n=1 Tax=Saltatorellus ferox TaxID=2528018 RepID=UPI003AF33345